MLFSDDLLCVEIELFAAAPTTRPPTQSPIAPSVPDIGPLTAIILVSDDKLFFLSNRVPGSATTERALDCVDLKRTVQAHTAYLQDFRFLVDFTLDILQTGTTTQSIIATGSSIIQPCLSLILIAKVAPI